MIRKIVIAALTLSLPGWEMKELQPDLSGAMIAAL